MNKFIKTKFKKIQDILKSTKKTFKMGIHIHSHITKLNVKN